MTALVEASGVTVRFGAVCAVDAVDLTLEAGSFMALTGASGAGKTTLLWALAGAVPLDAGRIEVDGAQLRSRTGAVYAGVVLVPQGSALVSVLTASENVLVPLLNAGVPARDARERTAHALEVVGLEEVGDHLVEELSGGQMQRVAVARALAARPRVLLADEPTSDLDPVNRERVIDALREVAASGAVVVMSTHDPDAAARADREMRLDEGRLPR